MEAEILSIIMVNTNIGSGVTQSHVKFEMTY